MKLSKLLLSFCVVNGMGCSDMPLCKQLTKLCHQVSVKLSCCIVPILILADTAKFEADAVSVHH